MKLSRTRRKKTPPEKVLHKISEFCTRCFYNFFDFRILIHPEPGVCFNIGQLRVNIVGAGRGIARFVHYGLNRTCQEKIRAGFVPQRFGGFLAGVTLLILPFGAKFIPGTASGGKVGLTAVKNDDFHSTGYNRSIYVFVTFIAETAYKDNRKPPHLGYNLSNAGRIQACFNKAVADYADIRIIPIPAQIYPGIGIHPADPGIGRTGH
jgi:hypothetical protein